MIFPFYVGGLLSLYLWSKKVCDRLTGFLELYCEKLGSLVSPGKNLKCNFIVKFSLMLKLTGEINEIYNCMMRKSWILWLLGILTTSMTVGFYVTVFLDYFTIGGR